MIDTYQISSENFEAIAGRQPTTWCEFAAKHRAEFAY